jgi:uncharacterized protein DUF4062
MKQDRSNRIRVLRVFLASPSDLGEERERTRLAVEAINRSVARSLGWHVELLGWEDTLPGVSRPQALINASVDCCDLFIGLLWERWGSPTGACSSGFEEEFERSRRRHADSGAPEIWLLFKEITPRFLDDPGEQLRKVIAFRGQQRKRRELLFREFAGAEDLYEKLWEYLSLYLLRLAATEQSSSRVLATTARDQAFPARDDYG